MRSINRHRFCGALRRSSPLILSVTAAVGAVATGILSAIGTKKAIENPDKNPVRYYIPAGLAGLGTIACIFGSYGISRKRERQLVSAVTMLQASLMEFQCHITDKEKLEAHRDDLPELEDPNLKLFYEPYTKTYFTATEEFVKDARYNLNRNFRYRYYTSLGEWIDFLDLDDNSDFLNVIGWDSSVMIQNWNVEWIDIVWSKTVLDDGLECYVIEYKTPATIDETLFPNARGDYILEAISQN